MSNAKEAGGLCNTPEYGVWMRMRRRCYDQKYRSYEFYGAKGIAVCEKWNRSFLAFLADVGVRPSALHSIDRFPNRNGNYEPGNVRWATQTQQMRNTNATVELTLNGITRPLCDWAEIVGKKRGTIHKRLRRGWTPEDAVGRNIDLSRLPLRVRAGVPNATVPLWSFIDA